MTDSYTYCPECASDLVELPYRDYLILECARGCGWWDEKHPVRKWEAADSEGGLTGNEDRLASAMKWAEIRAPRCEICGELERHKTKRGWRKTLARDHCHQTADRRGLLCASCNTGLGLFRDDPSLLFNAMEYLRKYQR